MADRITVKVEGVEGLLKNLKKYQLIKREACQIALKEQGFKVERDAKKNCPVQTGRLRASISTNWSKSGMPEGRKGGQAKGGDGVGQPPGERGLVVVVGTNVFYGPSVEFGSFTSLKVGGYRGRAGKLYLTKAYLAHEGETLNRIKKIFKKDEKL